MERGDRDAWPFVGGAAAALYFVATVAGASTFRMTAKPVPAVCLAAWAASASPDRYGRVIAAGLLLSSVGDLLLALPGDLFLHGLAAFLLAHLCYVAAFVSDVAGLRAGRAVPFVVFGVAAYLVLRPGLGSLAVPVAGYTAVICSMMWRAAARLGSSPRGRSSERAALAGAVVFAASDTLLAVDRFASPVPAAWLTIMLLYWAGQLGIALSAGRRGGTVPA